MKDVYYFPFPCKPSPRPRFGRGRTHMPVDYMVWKHKIRAIIGVGAQMYDKAAITIYIYKARTNSDVDNLAKSVLDAITGVLIPGDSVKHVPSLCVYYEPQDRGGFQVEVSRAQ